MPWSVLPYGGVLALADRVNESTAWEVYLQQYSGGIIALVLTAMVLLGLLILIPQVLRSHQRTAELQHTERMKALEAGQKLPQENALRNAAGRTAVIVPAISVCAAAAVTCYMVVNKSDNVIALALTVWIVTGAISLAAITAGVALMGRLAQLDEPMEEENQPQMNTDKHR
jgi:uncharacterized membrane protein